VQGILLIAHYVLVSSKCSTSNPTHDLSVAEKQRIDWVCPALPHRSIHSGLIQGAGFPQRDVAGRDRATRRDKLHVSRKAILVPLSHLQPAHKYSVSLQFFWTSMTIAYQKVDQAGSACE
jgi:hypothetical protein